MADRRPWPSAKPPEAATSIVVQRARALRASSEPEVRAFLLGLRAANAVAVDAAEDLYHHADASTGEDRLEGNARAAGAKLAAGRIGALYDAAATGTGHTAPRQGLRGLIRRLLGADHA